MWILAVLVFVELGCCTINLLNYKRNSFFLRLCSMRSTPHRLTLLWILLMPSRHQATTTSMEFCWTCIGLAWEEVYQLCRANIGGILMMVFNTDIILAYFNGTFMTTKVGKCFVCFFFLFFKANLLNSHTFFWKKKMNCNFPVYMLKIKFINWCIICINSMYNLCVICINSMYNLKQLTA